jgi:excinuclease UvrABC nuclease subunit
MNHYDITFKGYRRDQDTGSLPHYSGVYLVYRCRYIKETNRLSLIEIIYIGQAKDLNERLNKHDRHDDFMQSCHDGEELCYAYASVDERDLNVVESSLIFAQKPPLNTEHIDSFGYDDSSFSIDGECALLEHTKYSIS